MTTDHDAVALVALRDEPLSVDEVLDAVRHPACGGIALFVGVVRDHDHGDVVTALDYEAHPSAEDAMRAVCDAVAGRSEALRVAAVHRTGSLQVGDLAVVVAAAAPHRGQAFDAARDVIDTLKVADPDLEAPAARRRLDRVGGTAVSTPSHDVVSDGPVGGPADPGGPRIPGMPPGADSSAHHPGRPGVLPAALLTVTFVAIAIAAALSFIGLPYAVMSPGPATNILGEVDGKPLLVVDGATTYPTDGTLDFTTVSVEGGPGAKVTLYDVARAWLADAEEVVPVDQVFPPDADEEQVEEEGAAEMAESQSVATATALRALGRDVDQTVVIAGVPDGSPSAGLLEPDDVLVSVDGDPATSADAVRAAVQRHGPGDVDPHRRPPRRRGAHRHRPHRRVRRPHRHRRRARPRLRPPGRRHPQHRQRRRALGRPHVQPRDLRRADPG